MLTTLLILSCDRNSPVLPTVFLGGSAPRLQYIHLEGIPFPALPTLLLSTSDLVEVELWNIPITGYISPEAMIVGLAAFTRLKAFDFQFRSATSHPDRIRQPPAARTVLPALTYFKFQGASEYLEENLAARIESPQLDWIHISYLNQLVDFRVFHLAKFVDRAVGPKLTQFRYAQVRFDSGRVTFDMPLHANDSSPDPLDSLTNVFCPGIDWQVSHMAQVLSHISATLSNVVHLKLEVRLENGRQLEGDDDVDWLHGRWRIGGEGLAYTFSTNSPQCTRCVYLTSLRGTLLSPWKTSLWRLSPKRFHPLT